MTLEPLKQIYLGKTGGIGILECPKRGAILKALKSQ
jgi:hypothetical protein